MEDKGWPEETNIESYIKSLINFKQYSEKGQSEIDRSTYHQRSNSPSNISHTSLQNSSVSLHENTKRKNDSFNNQLSKLEQELGVTKEGLVKFQRILDVELESLDEYDTVADIVNNDELKRHLTNTMNSHKNPDFPEITENVLVDHIYLYLVVRKSDLKKSSDEKALTFELDTQGDEKRSSINLNLTKETFLKEMPDANYINTNSRHDILKLIIDRIMESVEGEILRKHQLIEICAQYSYTHLLSMVTKDFQKPQNLAEDLSYIINKSKENNYEDIYEILLKDAVEEDYEILPPSPPKSSLTENRATQKLVKHKGPSPQEFNLVSQLPLAYDETQEKIIRSDIITDITNPNEYIIQILALKKELARSQAIVKQNEESLSQDKKLKEHYQKTIRDQTQKIQQLQDNLNLAERRVKIMDQKHQKDKEVIELSKMLEKTNEDEKVSNLELMLKKSEDDRNLIKTRISELENEVETLMKSSNLDYAKSSKIIEELNNCINSKDSELTAAKYKLIDLKIHYDGLLLKKEQECEHHIKEIAKLPKLYDDANDLDTLKNKMKAAHAENSELREKFNLAKTRFEETFNKLNTLKSEIQTSQSDSNKLKFLEEVYKEKLQKIESLENNMCNREEFLQEQEKELKDAFQNLEIEKTNFQTERIRNSSKNKNRYLGFDGNLLKVFFILMLFSVLLRFAT